MKPRLWVSKLLLALLASLAVFAGSRLTVREIANPEASSTLFGWDTAFYHMWLRSTLMDGDVDFENDIQICDTLTEEDRGLALQGIPRTATGMVPNKYPIGWAAFHAPWFALGHGTALGADALGFEVRTDGFGSVYEAWLYFGSVFYAGVSLWLTWLLLRRFFGERIAWESLVLVWASSFLVFYQLRQYGMAHGLTYLCMVSAYFWSFAIRDFPPLGRNWALLGLSVGMLMVTRYQAGVYLLFPAAVALCELLTRRAGFRQAFCCVAAMAVPIALQLAAWKLLFGSWLVYTYQGEGFNWESPEWYRSLFDANHGLFYWHPVFLVGLLSCLVFIFSGRERLSWVWLLSMGLTYAVNAAWHCWWFGFSFGNRAYEGVTFFVFLGVGSLLAALEAAPWGRVPKLLLYGVLGAFAFWNIGVLEVIQYPWATEISLEGAESYGDLAHAIWDHLF